MSLRRRVLFVDDDEQFRYATARSLEAAGYDVVSFPDYRLALPALEREDHFDILLVDIVMPDRVNGFALARMARMRRPKLKVIYLTAFDLPTSEAVGKVLRKPVAIETLTAEIETELKS